MARDPLIVGISGKKQAGKSTLCSFLEHTLPSSQVGFTYGPDVKTYNFSDSLKERICKDVLGLSDEMVNGTDQQKSQFTGYVWEKLPMGIREKYSSEYIDVPITNKHETYYEQKIKPRSGYITGREIMQIIGTDIFRQMFDENIWVNATFNQIHRNDPDIALIADVRFPSEVNAIYDHGGYIIRLTRSIYEDKHSSETALDDYDFSQISDRAYVLNNQDINIGEKNTYVFEWLDNKCIALDSFLHGNKNIRYRTSSPPK